jgi:uncharacterized protein (TIGR03437 family)
VTFQTHAATPVPIANASILFATNGQINVLVPDAVKAYIGSTVDIVVNFGYGSGATMLRSAPYSVTVAATNPGVFAVGGVGQGDAAALMSPSYALVTNAAPAAARNPATDSDVIQLYVTGLGVPDSVDSAAAWPASSTTCMALGTYWAAVNSWTGASPALTSADGLVVQSGLLTAGTVPPCVKATSANVPSVTIGGVAATVLYAGWVPDSVAGLYQINVQLPNSSSTFTNAAGASGSLTTSAAQLPIVVQAGAGKYSQLSGVNLWVIPRLKVVASGAVSGVKNALWAGSAVTASDGTGPYVYTITSGSLPAGLALDADTGAISGTPTAAGVNTVVFTATDSAGWIDTVSITFTITLT